MAAMVKQYGKQKGKEVFYASKNKGTIEGVEETKMSYIDKVLSLDEQRRLAVTKRTMSGKTRTRIVSGEEKTRGVLRTAKKRGAEREAVGPKGYESQTVVVPNRPGRPDREETSVRVVPQNEAYTVYQHIGILMAEALGFVTENDSRIPRSARKTHAPRQKTRPMFGQNPDGSPIVKPGQKQRKIPGTPFTTPDLTPEQEAKLRAQSGRRKPVEEGEEPTDKEIASANRKVHTKKTVRGETAKETKDFDQEVERTMGKKRVGAEGGIEGLRARIRAAGQSSRR